MKRMFSCIALIVLLYGCKNGTTDSPKSTVASFIDASKEGNIDEVKKYITRSDVSLMEMGEGFLAKLDSNGAKGMKDKMSKEFKDKTSNFKIEIKDEKIDGDNAVVNVEYQHDGKSETHPISLKKEDGKWKVSLLSTGMQGMGGNQDDMQQAMKDMDIDSLKGSISKGMEEFNKMDKDSLKKVMEGAMKELEKLKDVPEKKQ